MLLCHRLTQALPKHSEEYDGEIWVEVMLVKGLNGSEEELETIKGRLSPLEAKLTYIT